MNKPIINKGDLTYVWQTNAPQKQLMISGTEITYHIEGYSNKETYKNAIVGRPRGAEDLEEDQEDANFISFRLFCSGEEMISFTSKPATIAENQRSGYAGIYTLK